MLALQQRLKAGDMHELDELVAAMGATAKVRLFKSGFIPSFLSVLADFVAEECDFVGYAAVTVLVWSAVVYDANDQPTAFSGAKLFTNSDATMPNSVGGVWVDTGGTDLVRYYLFENPIAVTTAGDFVSVNVALQQGPDGYVDVLT